MNSNFATFFRPFITNTMECCSSLQFSALNIEKQECGRPSSANGMKLDELRVQIIWA